MKKIAVLILVLIASVSYGAFDDIGWGIRARGMGNAFYGVWDEITGINYNPACVSHASNIATTFIWGKPFIGIDQGTMSYFDLDVVIPFFNRVPLAGKNFFLKDGALAISIHRFAVSELYSEGVYSFLYSKILDDVLSKGAKISGGIKFNIFHRSLEVNEDTTTNPLLAGGISKTSFGIDVGITYDFSQTIRIGLVFQNILKPNVAIIDGNEEYLPTTMRIGMNWNYGTILFLEDVVFGVGATKINRDEGDNREMDLTYQFGVEFWEFNKLLGVRLGYEKGIDQFTSYSAGLSVKKLFSERHEVQIDYAVVITSVGFTTRHSFGLVYRYKLPRSYFAYEKAREEELRFEEELERKKRELEEKGVLNVEETNSSTNI